MIHSYEKGFFSFFFFSKTKRANDCYLLYQNLLGILRDEQGKKGRQIQNEAREKKVKGELESHVCALGIMPRTTI